MKKIVLVASYGVDDGWYGENFRIILSKTDKACFTTKTEAKKYASALKKYVKVHHTTEKPRMSCNELDSYVEYTYCANGPSLSYYHINVAVKDLVPFMKPSTNK